MVSKQNQIWFGRFLKWYHFVVLQKCRQLSNDTILLFQEQPAAHEMVSELDKAPPKPFKKTE